MESMLANHESMSFSNPDKYSLLNFLANFSHFDQCHNSVPYDIGANFSNKAKSNNTIIITRDKFSNAPGSTVPQNSNFSTDSINIFDPQNSLLLETVKSVKQSKDNHLLTAEAYPFDIDCNCQICQYFQSIKELEKVLLEGPLSNELSHWIAFLVCFFENRFFI